MYLNHKEVDITPTWTGRVDERSGVDPHEDVYANHDEMRIGGATGPPRPPRPESDDSSNYLNAHDMEIIRNAKGTNVNSMYAPPLYAVPRK